MVDDWLTIANVTFNGIGLFCFAISGALLAVQKRMDAVGMCALALATALGGGILRDLLIGATPVAALVDWWMMAVALGGGLAVFALHRWMRHLASPVLVFDAIGLGIFCVQGTLKAVELGVNPIAAATVGTLTGVGGGVLRDILANDIPVVFRRESRLYLVPALIGGIATAALASNGITSLWIMTVVAVIVVALRLLSELLGWRVPAMRTEAIRVIHPD